MKQAVDKIKFNVVCVSFFLFITYVNAQSFRGEPITGSVHFGTSIVTGSGEGQDFAVDDDKATRAAAAAGNATLLTAEEYQTIQKWGNYATGEINGQNRNVRALRVVGGPIYVQFDGTNYTCYYRPGMGAVTNGY